MVRAVLGCPEDPAQGPGASARSSARPKTLVKFYTGILWYVIARISASLVLVRRLFTVVMLGYFFAFVLIEVIMS